MPTPTPELGLSIALAADNEPTYLTAAADSLPESLTIIDGLFNVTSGHNHNGAGEGAPITLADASVTPAMLLDPLTQPGIAAPVAPDLPPVGSWRLYPHADGQYFKIDSTGVELPIVAPGAIPDPLSIGTLIVLTSATTPPLQQAELAATPATGLPPAGSRLLYPKADGYYYSVDDAGVEQPVAAAVAAIPPTVLTGSMHSIGSDMLDQVIAALATHGIVDDAAVTP